jgi:hypothetical protein
MTTRKRKRTTDPAVMRRIEDPVLKYPRRTAAAIHRELCVEFEKSVPSLRTEAQRYAKMLEEGHLPAMPSSSLTVDSSGTIGFSMGGIFAIEGGPVTRKLREALQQRDTGSAAQR